MKIITLSFLLIFSFSAFAQKNIPADSLHRYGNQGPSEQAPFIHQYNYHLENRTLVKKLTIDSLSDKNALISVNITVNNKGKVIDVTGPAHHTTINDQDLLNRAMKAAKKARFNKCKTPEIQKGTMNFRFYKR